MFSRKLFNLACTQNRITSDAPYPGVPRANAGRALVNGAATRLCPPVRYPLRRLDHPSADQTAATPRRRSPKRSRTDIASSHLSIQPLDVRRLKLANINADKIVAKGPKASALRRLFAIETRIERKTSRLEL